MLIMIISKWSEITKFSSLNYILFYYVWVRAILCKTISLETLTVTQIEIANN